MPTVNWTVRPSATARVVVHGHGNGAVALGKKQWRSRPKGARLRVPISNPFDSAWAYGCVRSSIHG